MAPGSVNLSLRLDDYAELEGMLAALRLSGAHIEEMELIHTDLEDVFLRLTAPGGAP
jgi:ABC-2 type transport system ATP-binding protein